MMSGEGPSAVARLVDFGLAIRFADLEPKPNSSDHAPGSTPGSKLGADGCADLSAALDAVRTGFQLDQRVGVYGAA